MTDINISNSIYEIQDSFLQMASNQNYFNIDGMSTMKTGLFGYITNVAAMIARNSVFQKELYFNELFLNTANIPKSIYNYAKRYEVEIEQAIPARTSFLLSMKRQDIIDNSFEYNPSVDATLRSRYEEQYPVLARSREAGIITDTATIFVIDEKNNFTLDTFNFKLARSIIVNVTKNVVNGEYSITAQYALLPGVEEFPLEPVSSPYIKTWIQNDATNTARVYMLVDVWQMEKKTITFPIFSENVADTIMFDVDYSDQLAFFRVRYNRKNVDEIPVGIYSYLDESYDPGEGVTGFCYHTFPDENKLRIFFANSFKPEFNSEIEIETYTTLGSVANLPKYNNEILFRFEEAELTRIQVAVLATSNTAGGTDRPTLKELKQKIINRIVYRNQLIDEIDLNNYFDIVSSSRSVNSSSINFVRKRDDILRREFLAFLLLRDSLGQIIPTNTCTLSLIEADIDEDDRLVILPNRIVVYEKTAEIFRLATTAETDTAEHIADLVDDSDYILYVLPFLAVADTSSGPLLVYYYLTTVNTSELMDFSNPNVSLTKELLISKIEAKRDISITDGKLKLFFNINTNIDNFGFPTKPSEVPYLEPVLEDYTLGVLEPTNSPTDTSGTEPLITDPAYTGDVPAFNAAHAAWLLAHNVCLEQINIWNDAHDAWQANYDKWDAAHDAWELLYNAYLVSKESYDQDCTDILNDRIIVTGTLSKNGTDYGWFKTKVLGPSDTTYFDADNPDHETLTFSSLFELDDANATEGQISLINSLSDTEAHAIAGTNKIADVPIDEDVVVTLKAYYSPDSSVDVNSVVGTYISDDLHLGFTTVNPIYFFRTLEDVMTSEVIVDSGTGDKTVKLVPLVSRRYILDEAGDVGLRLNELMSLLWAYGDLLALSFDKIENNTKFDLKFFNTHGVSTSFKHMETDGTVDTNSIVNSDISISLNIKLLRPQLYSLSLNQRIKSSIVKYVEDLNKNDGILSFSNLSSYLESNFLEIQFIQLVGIDGDTKTLINTQIKTNSIPVNEHTINIPEFLNVKILNPDTLEKDITIKYIT